MALYSVNNCPDEDLVECLKFMDKRHHIGVSQLASEIILEFHFNDPVSVIEEFIKEQIHFVDTDARSLGELNSIRTHLQTAADLLVNNNEMRVLRFYVIVGVTRVFRLLNDVAGYCAQKKLGKPCFIQYYEKRPKSRLNAYGFSDDDLWNFYRVHLLNRTALLDCDKSELMSTYFKNQPSVACIIRSWMLFDAAVAPMNGLYSQCRLLCQTLINFIHFPVKCLFTRVINALGPCMLMVFNTEYQHALEMMNTDVMPSNILDPIVDVDADWRPMEFMSNQTLKCLHPSTFTYRIEARERSLEIVDDTTDDEAFDEAPEINGDVEAPDSPMIPVLHEDVRDVDTRESSMIPVLHDDEFPDAMPIPDVVDLPIDHENDVADSISPRPQTPAPAQKVKKRRRRGQVPPPGEVRRSGREKKHSTLFADSEWDTRLKLTRAKRKTASDDANSQQVPSSDATNEGILDTQQALSSNDTDGLVSENPEFDSQQAPPSNVTSAEAPKRNVRRRRLPSSNVPRRNSLRRRMPPSRLTYDRIQKRSLLQRMMASTVTNDLASETSELNQQQTQNLEQEPSDQPLTNVTSGENPDHDHHDQQMPPTNVPRRKIRHQRKPSPISTSGNIQPSTAPREQVPSSNDAHDFALGNPEHNPHNQQPLSLNVTSGEYPEHTRLKRSRTKKRKALSDEADSQQVPLSDATNEGILDTEHTNGLVSENPELDIHDPADQQMSSPNVTSAEAPKRKACRQRLPSSNVPRRNSLRRRAAPSRLTYDRIQKRSLLQRMMASTVTNDLASETSELNQQQAQNPEQQPPDQMTSGENSDHDHHDQQPPSTNVPRRKIRRQRKPSPISTSGGIQPSTAPREQVPSSNDTDDLASETPKRNPQQHPSSNVAYITIPKRGPLLYFKSLPNAANGLLPNDGTDNQPPSNVASETPKRKGRRQRLPSSKVVNGRIQKRNAGGRRIPSSAGSRHRNPLLIRIPRPHTPAVTRSHRGR